MQSSAAGDMISVSYNLKLSRDGVVSLDSVKPFVSKVSCSRDGRIRIKLSDSLETPDLDTMYPVGAILVINTELFGECLLNAEAEDEDDEDDDDIAATSRAGQFRDAYLIIESVSGLPTDATVRGTPTDYFALFEEAEIDIINTDSDFASTSSRILTDINTVSRATSRELELNLFSLGPLSVNLKGTATDRGGFSLLKARWDRRGIDLQLQLALDYEFTAELSVKLSVGAGFGKKVEDLISIPLAYALPKIDFLEGKKLGPFILPAFKIGFFFEVPIVASIRAEVEKEIGSVGTAFYKTGRKEIVFFVKGSYGSVDSGVRTLTAKRAQSDATWNMNLPGDTPVKINLVSFVGLRPQLAGYLPLVEARISVEYGIELKGSYAAGDDAFKPDTTSAVRKIGVCDTCHKVTVEASRKLQNAGIFARLGLTASIPIFGRNISVPLNFGKISIPLPLSPTFTSPIVKACFVRQFSERTITCGENCCDSDSQTCERTSGMSSESVCSGSPSPTPSPSNSPTQSPTQSPTPTPTPPGRLSSCYTDPHLRTFDGLSYDCQAIGEFVLVKGKMFEIQGRFGGPDTRGTVVKGVAISGKNIPTVQVSIPSDERTPTDDINGCPIVLFVDGIARPVASTGALAAKVTVVVSSGRIQITQSSGVSVSFRTQRSSSFGCYFESLNVFLPETVVSSQRVLGLLGSPNRDSKDDWMSRSGAVLPAPRTSEERLFEKAYNYCTANWCVKTAADSLFTYERGSSHSTFSKCNQPYGTQPDFSSAPQALRNLCGNDAACLVDGLAGNVDDAENALSVQAEIDEAVSQDQEFRANPSTIAAGSTVNILLTMDVTGKPRKDLRDLDAFAIFRVDTDSGDVTGDEILRLEDAGSSLTSDAVANDGIFSNIVPLLSSMGGERFSFRAVPIVAGSQDNDSPLAVTTLNAVRSYSPSSSIGTVGNNNRSVSIGSLTGLELAISYSWPADQSDLDTATAFAGEVVGFSCSGAIRNYVTFTSDDDTSSGGIETVVVEIDRAREDGVWDENTEISFSAGWYSSRGGSGPATLRMGLRDSETKQEIVGTGLALPINPGRQFGCSSTVVGLLRISVAERVVLRLQLP